MRVFLRRTVWLFVGKLFRQAVILSVCASACLLFCLCSVSAHLELKENDTIIILDRRSVRDLTPDPTRFNLQFLWNIFLFLTDDSLCEFLLSCLYLQIKQRSFCTRANSSWQSSLVISFFFSFLANRSMNWPANEWCCFPMALDSLQPCFRFESQTILDPVLHWTHWWRHWRISQHAWRPGKKWNPPSFWKLSKYANILITIAVTRRSALRKIYFQGLIIWRMWMTSFDEPTSEKKVPLVREAVWLFKGDLCFGVQMILITFSIYKIVTLTVFWDSKE